MMKENTRILHVDNTQEIGIFPSGILTFCKVTATLKYFFGEHEIKGPRKFPEHKQTGFIVDLSFILFLEGIEKISATGNVLIKDN